MAVEMEYLTEKFTTKLSEPDGSKLPCHAQFKQLEALIGNQKPVSSLPKEKLKSLREKLHEIHNILDDCQKLSRDRKFYNLPKDGMFIHNTKNRLIKIKEELKNELENELENEQNGNTPAAQSNGTTDSNPVVTEIDNFRGSNRSVDSKVFGFEDDVMEMEKMILERPKPESFKGIGIIGKSGIGKTTLAQVIFNKKEVKEQFLPRIWVPMSKQEEEKENSKEEIVKRMLVSLGVEDEVIKVAERKEIAGLLFALQLRLRGKRYLIVLDDVWNTDPWYNNLEAKLTDVCKIGEQLAYGFPKGYGGTVIVTSREEDIVKNMVAKENIHRVLPLSNPESVWSIFMESLKRIWLQSYKFKPRAFTPKEEIIILETEILRRHNPDSFNGIGIIREDDGGKTTLVGEIFKRSRVKEYFEPMILEKMPKQQDEAEVKDKKEVANVTDKDRSGFPEGDEDEAEDRDTYRKKEEANVTAKMFPKDRFRNSKEGDENEAEVKDNYRKKEAIVTDKKIVEDMLVSLKVGEDIIKDAQRKDISGLLSALQLQLKGKRYLIVLDDVRSKVTNTRKNGELEWIKEISKWGKGYGGTVIVETADKGLAAEMVGEENIYQLPLNSNEKEHYWSIFLNYARKVRSDKEEESLRNYLEDLKVDVVENCHGIPLAAEVMGRIMYEQIKEKPERELDNDDIAEASPSPTANEIPEITLASAE